MKLPAYLRLIRPANIVTAVADIMAGFAVASSVFVFHDDAGLHELGWLILSTVGLYGGGIVLNDVFDLETDKVERPERPLPRGEISLRSASTFAVVLYLAAVISAFQVSVLSGGLAILIAVLATVYDKYGKHFSFWGPVNMGLCRALNLMLGCSAVASVVQQYWYLTLLPFILITGVTLISKGEVHGAGRRMMLSAAFVFFMLFVALFALNFIENFSLIESLPFQILFLIFIAIPLTKAIRTGEAGKIRKAVKAGVLSIILLDAAIAAGFIGVMYGAGIICLLPVSVLLAQTFAVT